MKEKHEAATEALLSALADSQRTTKTLRVENEELRQQIRTLETELKAVVGELARSQNYSPAIRALV
jgi:cell division protein FtsB